ncbi:MAG TPA: hotdog fold thioesterase [Anditalea sp.]|nr:hotdog fold thioesterase [Anditalea sp.]
MIFTKNLSLDFLNKLAKDTMTSHIGIEFTEVGEDFISATMPVDDRTKQSYGMLHGGANVVLAETLGSIAANFTVDTDRQYCVGLEINANHLKSVREGFVKGTARPIHIGKKTQVWEIRITNPDDQLTCISRLTMAVLEK